MSIDEQEALSRVHDSKGLKLVLLRSGRFAISDMWGRQLDIADEHELTAIVKMWFSAHAFKKPDGWGQQQFATQTSKTAEELGL